MNTRSIMSYLLFLFALSFCVFAIQSGDAVMYLALTRDFILSGKWLQVHDPYLYSLPDARLVWQHEHLSYLYYYGFHLLAGAAGLIFAKALLLALLFILVLRAKPLDANRNLLWMFMWTIAVLAGSFRFIERSSVFSDVLCVWMCAFLLERKRLSSRDLITLALVFLAWVQLHPGYPIGVGLLGLWVLHRLFIEKSIHWKTALLALLPTSCLLLNPLGLDGAIYPIQFALSEASVLRLSNFEWMPSYHPSFRFAPEVMAFWLLMGIALFFVIKDKLFRELGAWIAIAALIIATQTVRFIPWASFAVILALKPWLIFKSPAINRSILPVLFSIALLAVAIKNLTMGYESSSGKRIASLSFDPKFFPSRTVEFLKTQRIPGRVYNTHDFGSMLIWDGLTPVFHHGFVTDMNFYASEVMGVFQSQARFLELARKYNWTMLLVEKYGAFKYFHKILSPLPEWKIVAEDEASYLIYWLPDSPPQ